MDKLQIPAGYKQTEVGVIPEDWEVIQLQKVCRAPITYGIVQCGPHINNGVPYIRVSDMNSNELDVTEMLRTSSEIASSFSRSKVDEGDIVYALRGKLGEVKWVGPSVAGANLTQGTARISPSKGISNKYLFWTLRSPQSLKQALQEAKGSTFVEITLANLKEIEVPVPKLMEEQTAIANALSDVDALIAALEKLIDKKSAIKTATMQQLLTGKKRLPPFDQLDAGYKQTELGEIPKDWEVDTIGNSAELITKGTTPMTIGRSFEQSGVTFVKVESVNERGHFDRSKFAYIDEITNKLMSRSQMCEGDLLISIAGALGRAIIVPKNILPANTNQALAIVRFKGQSKLSSLFVYHYTKSTIFKKHIEATSSQGAQPNLSLGDIANFPIFIPKYEEQTVIANVLSDMDTELDALQQRLAKTQHIKQGMMQELLTGKTRLI